MSFWEPLFLSIKLAILTTCILFILGILISWGLASLKSGCKPFWEVIINLPLMLPPTVLGFYLLIIFSPENTVGKFLQYYFQSRLVFTFEGLLFASVLFNIPFMVNPLLAGLTNLPSTLKEASSTLGKSGFVTLIRVLLPAIRPSLASGCIMTFAHTMGEFGVVMMIGGNIPGETRVASIAIYNEVEAMNYTNAHYYSAIMLTFILLVLLVLQFANRNTSRGKKMRHD
ncbi:MAG: molybdate ABC transporter permease subunit [Spirochaetia bacterium]|nr:molybdate ABC transporter permease subunit [Spirochaetia bacterium]